MFKDTGGVAEPGGHEQDGEQACSSMDHCLVMAPCAQKADLLGR